MLRRFDGVLIAVLGLILICLGAVCLAIPNFDYAASLFVGGIIFTVFGFYIIEFYKKQELKPRKR
jgi:uncharacterized membrane protein HdeD (DUF308 family)